MDGKVLGPRHICFLHAGELPRDDLSTVYRLVDLPLNDHNLILVLDWECVVKQCVRFMFFHLFDDFGYKSRYLEDDDMLDY